MQITSQVALTGQARGRGSTGGRCATGVIWSHYPAAFFAASIVWLGSRLAGDGTCTHSCGKTPKRERTRMATSGAEEGPTPEEAPTERHRGSDNASAGDGLAVDAGACPAAGSASASDAGGAPLSKNQQKKLAKRARFVEQRTARKAIRKERRKEQREQRMQHAAAEGGEVGEGGEGGPPEKKQRHEEGPRAKDWVGRQGGRGSRSREAFDEERKKGQRVVVDLGFDSLMTEREVRSLVTQVAHLYGCNRKSAKPLHLHLASVGQRCEEVCPNATLGSFLPKISAARCADAC